MGIWATASELAAKTPPDRNRYVDFLRAVSILVVVVGHWLIATAYYADGELTPGHLLRSEPQLHWITWLFQVMPIFFIVGGYSNAVSLQSARRRGVDYAGWLVARIGRLVTPLLLLFVVWAAIAVVMHLLDARPVVIQFTSRSAMIPTWFLAIYIMVVLLAPLTYALWEKLGFLSFWLLVALAIATDMAFFMADQRWLGWSNYFWIWLAVHQLGFAWRDGRLWGAGMLAICAVAAFAALYFLIDRGPYPLAMVSSPDEDVSNTLPPKITLLVLGIVQFGVLLALEGPMRRALSGLKLWTATVLINSMIMTIYLWHVTVMVIVVALAYYAGGLGLGIEPGTGAWWASRPVWIAVLFIGLLPVALLMSPLERSTRKASATIPSGARQVTGAIMISLGVALLAMYGYGGAPIPRLDVVSLALVVAGAGLSGVLPALR